MCQMYVVWITVAWWWRYMAKYTTGKILRAVAAAAFTTFTEINVQPGTTGKSCIYIGDILFEKACPV